MLTGRQSFLSRFLLLPTVVLLSLPAGSFAQPQRGPVPSGSPHFEGLLSREVNHQLLLLPWYSVFENLQYKINGGEVTLLGQVLSDTTKSEAESRVKQVEGVTQVINNIELLPPSPNDDAIRRAAFRAIFRDPALEVYGHGSVLPIHIIVQGGHVTLEGAVLNQGHKNLAGMRARAISGVFSVTNNLRIETSKTQPS